MNWNCTAAVKQEILKLDAVWISFPESDSHGQALND